MDTDDFPQADDLEKVYQTVRAVAAGHVDDVGIENAIGLNSMRRQGRYYRKAAQALGFIVNTQNAAALTTEGLRLSTVPSMDEKVRILRAAVKNLEPLSELLGAMGSEGSSKAALSKFYRSIYPGKPSTAKRRVSTAFNYLLAVGLAEFDEKDGTLRPASASVSSPVDLSRGPEKVGFVYDPAILAPPRNEASPGFMQVDVDLQKHERAIHAHERLVNQKALRLQESGIESRVTSHIDLMAAHDGSNVIYEMKSTNSDAANQLDQIRKAVAQLHEYRYIYELDAVLCIVMDAPLRADLAWLGKYLAVDRQIAFVWLDLNGEFHTHVDSARLLQAWM